MGEASEQFRQKSSYAEMILSCKVVLSGFDAHLWKSLSLIADLQSIKQYVQHTVPNPKTKYNHHRTSQQMALHVASRGPAYSDLVQGRAVSLKFPSWLTIQILKDRVLAGRL